MPGSGWLCCGRAMPCLGEVVSGEDFRYCLCLLFLPCCISSQVLSPCICRWSILAPALQGVGDGACDSIWELWLCPRLQSGPAGTCLGAALPSQTLGGSSACPGDWLQGCVNRVLGTAPRTGQMCGTCRCSWHEHTFVGSQGTWNWVGRNVNTWWRFWHYA